MTTTFSVSFRESPIGFWNLGASNPLGCDPCNCDPRGSLNPVCSQETGKCSCKNLFESRRCDVCKEGFFKSDGNCIPCDCNVDHSNNPGELSLTVALYLFHFFRCVRARVCACVYVCVYICVCVTQYINSLEPFPTHHLL